MSYDMFGKREMTEAILQMMPVGNFFTRTFFNKAPKTHQQDAIDIDIYKGQRKVAPYTRSSAKSTPLARQAFSTQALSLPYIKLSRSLEAAMTLLRQPGEHIYDIKTPEQRAREQIALDLFEIEEAIVRAEELQAAQAIINANVVIKGEEVDAEIDFGRDSELEFTADELWSGEDVDIMRQLREWTRLVFKKSGYTPNTIIAGSDALDAFFANSRVQSLLDNKGVAAGGLDLKKNTSPFPGARYYGSFAGFDIWEYLELYLDDVTDTELELMPVDKIVLCSTGMKTEAHYGVIKDFGALVPMKRFAKSIKTEDPSTQTAIVQTAPAMINHTPDATALIKVV